MTAAEPLQHATPRRVDARSWRVVAAAMFVIGWGGNQFTPLLVVYRERAGYSAVAVDVFLGAYVLGLVPGLLVASALSDRHGRRPVLLAGVVASVVGSAALAFGPTGAAAILTGRFLSGLAVGIAMAVGTSWVTELSAPDLVPGVDPGAGARRSSIGLTLGLGVGPGVAGVLAQWGPWPLVLPFALQSALAAGVLGWLARAGVETHRDTAGTPWWRLRVPAAGHRRFLWVVLPMAPWIFGSAGIAYAIVPALVDDRVGHWALLFTTALTVATLGVGVAVAPVAKRLDDLSTARACLVAMALMTLGVAAAALTALTRQPALAFAVAVLLGAAYGIAVVSGLLEVQRIAAPDELAGLTGVYYSLAYVGFLLPAALAALARYVDQTVMLTALAVVALVATAVVMTGSRRHLPVPRITLRERELADT